MSHDLFGVGERDSSTRSRQSSLLLASAAVHAVVIAALVVISFLLPGVLPTPHTTAIAWTPVPRMVRLTDIALPPQRTATAAGSQAALRIPLAPSAPSPIPPDGIRPESADTFARGEPGPGTEPGSMPGVADLGATILEPPPPQRDVPAAPVRLHAGIEAPRKIRAQAPTYPTLARAAGAHGVVIIEATIDPRGDVVAAKVLRSVPMLDEAAVDAVRQWKFTPARLNGDAVAVLITVTVNFTLAER